MERLPVPRLRGDAVVTETEYDREYFEARDARRYRMLTRITIAVGAVAGGIGAILGFTMVKFPGGYEQFGKWWVTDLWPAIEPFVAAAAGAVALPLIVALIGAIIGMLWLDY